MCAANAAFLSGEHAITIVPKLRAPPIHLLSGRTIELTPPVPVEVPLWCASYLKKRDKCYVSIPEWLKPESLEGSLEEERRVTDKFSALPYHYVEIAKELLAVASDDLPDANRIRSLVADIEDIRRRKVLNGLQSLDESALSVTLNHVSAMELHGIRDVAAKALDQMRKFAAAPVGGATGASGAQQPSQAADRDERSERLLRALQRR